jgi:hypothetical protein
MTETSLYLASGSIASVLFSLPQVDLNALPTDGDLQVDIGH